MSSTRYLFTKEEISTMTKFCLFFLFLAQIFVCTYARAQNNVQPDSLGLPGDNLNLYAVLKIFQESPTLEEFEKRLNSEESRINNLDLDGDGKIDYIRVVDHIAGTMHDIVLQVAVTETESQDVAVIQVEKTAENPARIQIIGDEALYGKDYIIEPNYDPASEKVEGVTPNPGYIGTTSENLSLDGNTIPISNTTQAEVAGWPIIRYIYLPDYQPWLSPWHYSYYPPWWNPWRPRFWHYYQGYQYNQYSYYYGHYRRWHQYRNLAGRNDYYASIRSSSTIVLDRKRQGGFQRTYSRPDLQRKGINQYNRVYRGAMARPAEGKPSPPGVRRNGTTMPGGNKPAVARPGGNRQWDQGRSKPSTTSPGNDRSRRDSPTSGKPGKTRPPEGRAGSEKEGRNR